MTNSWLESWGRVILKESKLKKKTKTKAQSLISSMLKAEIEKKLKKNWC